MKKAIFSWSTGKDSALALHKILEQKEFEVVSLVTTVTEDYGRVSMHGLRTELLEMQAESVGIPLKKIFIPKECTNEIYEESFHMGIQEIINNGVNNIIFGDIHLEEIRDFRLKQMEKIGMQCVFPIWHEESSKLAERFIRLGFRVRTVCVDSNVLPKTFAGREYDSNFLSQLPDNIDKCGENGEFHTFAYNGPIFSFEVKNDIGDIVLRNGRFYYCDLYKTE